jgi:outer membrane lipoprotein carrier protein
MNTLITALFIVLLSTTNVMANGLSDLEKFLQSTTSGKSTFTQTITAPPKNGLMVKAKVSSGEFEFVRPGKFKFMYKKPYAQEIVANGKTIWLYDADLAQVTEKKQSAALGSSPAALLVWSKNMKEVKANFVLTATTDDHGFSWIKAVPKSKDTGLQYVKVGLKDGTLVAMTILDGFGL